MTDTKTEYLQQLSDEGIIRSESSLKYYKDSTEYVLKLSNGMLLPFEKPRITKSFYFGEDDRGDGTPEHLTMDNAIRCCHAAKTEEYFTKANLNLYDKPLKELDRETMVFVVPLYRDSKVVTYAFGAPRFTTPGFPPRFLSDEDIALIKNTLLMLREKFEKRLKSYWKRYGAKHIKTGTFWISR